MDSITLVHSDPDFYAPLSRSTRRGVEYAPAGMPADWTERHENVWTGWYPEHKLGGVTDGWKIHLSCRIERAQHVLDVAARIFVAHGVAFKHLSCSTFFVITHHKHAARSQSGKFCAAYPPDVATAEAVMRDLAAALDGEEGPFVLSDRRFADSRVVHYRYGAYTSRTRLTAEGWHVWLVRDGSGQDVPDVRGVKFQPPEGITDPFASDMDSGGGGTPVFGGVRFDKVLRHSNGGGAYRGTDVATGRTVFVKESRGHHGLVSVTSSSQDRLRNEYAVLRELHRTGPGLAPEPLRYFRHLENEFLVTEFVPGRSLRSWWTEHNPVIWSTTTEADYRAYYERAWRILDEVTAQVERLHELGYVFVDLSPDNVLVDDEDHVRLIDFETAARVDGPLTPIGTPGFFPPDPRRFVDDPVRYDEYALSSIALALIAPLNTTADLHSGVLAHLRAQIDPEGLVPDRIWALATRFRPPVGLGSPSPQRRVLPPSRQPVAQSPQELAEDSPRQFASPSPQELAEDSPQPLASPSPQPLASPSPRELVSQLSPWRLALPSPQEVAEDPLGCLVELRDGLVAGLTYPGHADGVVPLGPQSYATNALGLGHGLAGVVHALHVAGAPSAELLDRLATQAIEEADDLPPGLVAGQAGIAWVLAENGRVAEAEKLLARADEHPLLAGSATLGFGRAGVALTHLALYGHTGDRSYLDRAAEQADAIPRTDALTGLLGWDNATGLINGRPGIALLDYYLARLTGQEDRVRTGLDLLSTELDRAVRSEGGLLFPVSERDRRLMPYLATGSAGFLMVASRYLAATGDERLAAAMPELLRGFGCAFTHYGGLSTGMAGIALALHDHGRRHADEASVERAHTLARRMFLYAVPHPTGMYVPGEQGLRLSGDLWFGSAGVLVLLARLLDGQPDPLYTLDGLVE
ncbi:serine/threonine protein kinase [Amycolatopsis bartoniae]|uniref:Protein kinase domain-containing protein n=1 Tax=Amycolatopsis bartoniae TaxID=941986 RepID=A0A8H9MCB1_9PSEU|nr:class III lanthionine synthetase LanKC [Amycolatopsis bartoniae]MBB2937985.1 serine/threonine protein kinase [Amycolatopsis bartoniae]TVT07561.1 serine/threonine protein kinase [Amycolatopsis bartoniae]GHF42129.1 hypothetical protein GCM10017566_14630 [Amycolatopsis bartoniae]